jgi:hypothetical protein
VAPTRTRGVALYTLIWVAALAVSFLASHLDWWRQTGIHPLVLVASILPAFYLALLVHELGHLGAGLAAGFRFLSLSWGRLVLCRAPERLRLRWLPKAEPYGGLCACLPADDGHLRSRYALFIAGGPVASLLLMGGGIVTLAAGACGRGVGATLVLAVSAASLAVLGSCVIPHRHTGVPTDAARLGQVLRGGPRKERYCALGLLAGLMRTTLRPREWSRTLLARALAHPDGSDEHATACLYAHIWAKDRGDLVGAGRYLDLAGEDLATRSRSFQVAFALCAAPFEAMVRGNAAAARAWLAGIETGNLPDRHDLLMAEAAVLLVEGRRVEARARAAAGLAQMPRDSALGLHRMDEEGLRAVMALAGGRPPRRADSARPLSPGGSAGRSAGPQGPPCPTRASGDSGCCPVPR